MGLILDSSILIAGERGGESVPGILKHVQATHAKLNRAFLPLPSSN